jgi:TP901 family phage tail tape measure protein
VADRTVRVTLVAQASGYIAGMTQAAGATRALGSEAERLAQKRAAFDGLGRGFIALGVAAAVGVGVAIAKFAEFDQAMSQVQAVTQETAEGQKALWDAALEAGGRFPQTAREAANAEEELAKAGITTANILGGALTSSLQLASSGQLEVARSAEIVGITLKQFGLDGREAARVADVLTAGANKAVGGVEDLAQGLKFVGPVAESMNVSLEDTVATLALFADRGVIGEQAGTSLRGMLASLTSPSKEAKGAIRDLGIELYDGQGRFLGLENAAGQLNTALAGVSDAERDTALGLIFGNMQVTAARILVSSGAATWREYRDAVEDSGIAQRVAAERMNNLAGDVEKLGGAFDTALIQTGSGANDVLRSMVQTITGFVDWIGELPEPVLGVGLAFGAAAAAVGVLGGAALLAIPRLADLRLWMTAAGISGRSMALGIGAATIALTVAILAIGAFAAEQAASSARTDGFRDSLNQSTGAITKYTRELVVKRLEEAGAFKDAEQYGISQRELTDAVIEGGEALEAVKAKLDATSEGLTGNQARAEGLKSEWGAASTTIRKTSEELSAAREELENSQAATDSNTEALSAMGIAAGDAATDVGALADQIRGLADLTLSARDAERQFQAAIDAATESFAKNGSTLDISTEAGRENEAALDAIAKAAKEAAAAKYEHTQSEGAATAEIQAGRDALIAQLAQFGIVGQAAEDYADNLGLIPANIDTLVNLDTSGAQQALDRFIRLNTGRSVRVNGVVVNGPGIATGGYVTGPGTGTSDSIAARLSNGEYVINAESVKRVGVGFLDKVNSGKADAYAGGGLVSAPSVPVAPTWRAAPQVVTTTVSPVVYVQNPFTGEYLVARTVAVADARIQQNELSTATEVGAGGLA